MDLRGAKLHMQPPAPRTPPHLALAPAPHTMPPIPGNDPCPAQAPVPASEPWHCPHSRGPALLSPPEDFQTEFFRRGKEDEDLLLKPRQSIHTYYNKIEIDEQILILSLPASHTRDTSVKRLVYICYGLNCVPSTFVC